MQVVCATATKPSMRLGSLYAQGWSAGSAASLIHRWLHPRPGSLGEAVKEPEVVGT